MNKQLDTLEINQCSNNWSKIDFNKVTSISLNKQTNSFLNNNSPTSCVRKKETWSFCKSLAYTRRGITRFQEED